jgi:hypothetical protein
MWRKDAKWIAGILLTLVLGLALAGYNLYRFTSPRQAVDAMALAMAAAFSPRGLDDGADIAAVRQMLKVTGKKEFQPIPGLNIKIKESDFAGLPPREARLKFFRQLAEPIYFEGEAGLEKLAESAEMKKGISSGIGFLKFLSYDTHLFLRKIFLVFAALAAVLLILLVIFGRRLGRLAGPGCAFIIAALPGTALAALAAAAASHAANSPPPAEKGMTEMAGYIAGQILPGLLPPILESYILFLTLGVILVFWSAVAGIFLKLIEKIGGRKKSERKAT